MKKVFQILEIIGVVLFYLVLIGMIIWQIVTSWQTVKGWFIVVSLLIIFIIGIYTIMKNISHWPIIEDLVDRLKYWDPPTRVIILIVLAIMGIGFFIMSKL
jgi:hypothetical protein